MFRFSTTRVGTYLLKTDTRGQVHATWFHLEESPLNHLPLIGAHKQTASQAEKIRLANDLIAEELECLGLLLGSILIE